MMTTDAHSFEPESDPANKLMDCRTKIEKTAIPLTTAQISTYRVEELRPTQITVGFREVMEKRNRWRTKRDCAPMARATPAVLGPGARAYVLDRHHTLSALAAEGVSEVPVIIADDLSHLEEDAFWRVLIHRDWCHPYDAAGAQRSWRNIPKHFADLTDDPFRSLASALRRSGGYAKTPQLFSEFQWADYLRCHIPSEEIDADFDGALRVALHLAKLRMDRPLPNWSEIISLAASSLTQRAQPDQAVPCREATHAS